MSALRYLGGLLRAAVQVCLGWETEKAENVWESQLQIVLETPFRKFRTTEITL